VKWPGFRVSLTESNGVISLLERAVETGITFHPSSAGGDPAAAGAVDTHSSPSLSDALDPGQRIQADATSPQGAPQNQATPAKPLEERTPEAYFSSRPPKRPFIINTPARAGFSRSHCPPGRSAHPQWLVARKPRPLQWPHECHRAVPPGPQSN
jgi:hypothetical protein